MNTEHSILVCGVPRGMSRAFSLVEVLIAVLVLALGLLGLGAVFPVVVRQQRIATQTTLGLSAREATKQILFNNANFAPGGPGWEELHQYLLDNGRKGAWAPVAPDPVTKAYVFGAVTLPLSQRLFPLPYSSDAQPRFVWDITARLTNPLDPPDQHVMLVAIFIRPIDPGIRPGRYRDPDTDEWVPYSLTTSLIESGTDISRYPVAVDRDGRPTFDGRTEGAGGLYAVPLVAQVALAGVNPNERDVIAIRNMVGGDTESEVAIDLLAQPGQRFIDRAGHIHTVVGSRTVGGKKVIVFTPPLDDLDNDNDVEDDTNPILFVPQTPAVDPIVFTVSL
jgi:type II secretory pathway pseudopilin PulG